MKDKPLVIIITLLGGAVSSICCIIKGAGLLWTLLMTLISLLVFLIIGMIVNHYYSEIRAEVEAADKEKAEAEEAERLALLQEQQDREEWEKQHPGEPFPGELKQTEPGEDADAQTSSTK